MASAAPLGWRHLEVGAVDYRHTGTAAMTMHIPSARALRLALLFPLSLAVSPATAWPASPVVKVMTYNTHHGGWATTPSTTDRQLDTIAAQDPDVVALQEAYASQLTYYVDGLNSRLGTDAWHGTYASNCQEGSEPICSRYSSETVMILTRLTTLAVNARLIWAGDEYHVARPTIRMSVALEDGTAINVFVCHLPAKAAAARLAYVNTFQAWAEQFSGPKLVGGDFNATPGTAPIVAMMPQYADAWTLGGSGHGSTYPSFIPTRRIDYWFSRDASPESLTAVSVVGDPTDSDHLAVVASYALNGAPGGTGETTLLDERFDSFDATMWPGRVITGTQDSSIPLAIEDGMLTIGPLKESEFGPHYHGVSSTAYNLSHDGCASVQVVRSLNSATTAYAMFAVVTDTHAFYRWYRSGDALVAEQKIAGIKTTLVTLPFDATAHQFLRIRRVDNETSGASDVTFETSPGAADGPGPFTERHRAPWDGAIDATALRLELKAGTSRPETSPGSISWDNLRAATNCR
jgi:endonuclease/exonuclease/phosphatase family metal-dependent hydrolase